jgi:hypothetical protein
MVRTDKEATVALAMAPTTPRLLPGQYRVVWQESSGSIACRCAIQRLPLHGGHEGVEDVFTVIPGVCGRLRPVAFEACRRDPNGASRAKSSPAQGRKSMQTLTLLRRLSIIVLVVCTMGIPYAQAADN